MGVYTYNFRNQRVKKVAGGVTTVYHYDLAGNLIAESDGDGTITREYVYMGSELAAMPLAMVAGGAPYYYHTDQLGTPIRMSDVSGQIVWEAGYAPFGAANVGFPVVKSNLRLPGQYFDAETGLHYNWHRYYAPELGRYLQPDPLGLAGGDRNLYGYVLNNPLDRTDAFGLQNTPGSGIIPYRLPDEFVNVRGMGLAFGLASGGQAAAAQYAIVWDNGGRVGFAVTRCGGGLSDAASVTIAATALGSTAPEIADLAGTSLDIPLSFSGPGISPTGGISTAFGKDRCGKSTRTNAVTAGITASLSPVDMGGLGCVTTVIPFN